MELLSLLRYAKKKERKIFGVSQSALALFAEQCKPSGECLINAAKPERLNFH